MILKGDDLCPLGHLAASGTLFSGLAGCGLGSLASRGRGQEGADRAVPYWNWDIWLKCQQCHSWEPCSKGSIKCMGPPQGSCWGTVRGSSAAVLNGRDLQLVLSNLGLSVLNWHSRWGPVLSREWSDSLLHLENFPCVISFLPVCYSTVLLQYSTTLEHVLRAAPWIYTC